MQTAKPSLVIASALLRSTCSFARRSHMRASAMACHRWMRICPHGQRLYSTADVMPPAAVEGDKKEYAPKIQKLVDDISKLTLMEVADLNELLKKTLNISDAPVMAMGAMAAAPAKEEEEETQTQTQQVSFTVRLMGFEDAKKVALIKEMRSQIEGMNLVQAKKFVESLPQTVKADITKEESEKLKQALEAAGGKVEVD